MLAYDIIVSRVSQKGGNSGNDHQYIFALSRIQWMRWLCIDSKYSFELYWNHTKLHERLIVGFGERESLFDSRSKVVCQGLAQLFHVYKKYFAVYHVREFHRVYSECFIIAH